MSAIKEGEPFIMAVMEGNTDGTVDVINNNMGASAVDKETSFVRGLTEDVQDHGGSMRVYLCVPIGRIWTDDDGDPDNSTNAPDRVVTVDMTEAGIERMVAIGATINIKLKED